MWASRCCNNPLPVLPQQGLLQRGFNIPKNPSFLCKGAIDSAILVLQVRKTGHKEGKKSFCSAQCSESAAETQLSQHQVLLPLCVCWVCEAKAK